MDCVQRISHLQEQVVDIEKQLTYLNTKVTGLIRELNLPARRDMSHLDPKLSCVSSFFAECCTKSDSRNDIVSSSALFNAFQLWCNSTRQLNPCNIRQFVNRFEKVHPYRAATSRSRGFRFVVLLEKSLH